MPARQLFTLISVIILLIMWHTLLPIFITYYLRFAVSDKFGSSSPQTEVFILAPTTSRPVLMERYSGKLPAQLLKAILAIFVRIVYLHALILGMCSLFQVYHIKPSHTINATQKIDTLTMFDRKSWCIKFYCGTWLVITPVGSLLTFCILVLH